LLSHATSAIWTQASKERKEKEKEKKKETRRREQLQRFTIGFFRGEHPVSFGRNLQPQPTFGTFQVGKQSEK
jgi:hypothetical protein